MEHMPRMGLLRFKKKVAFAKHRPIKARFSARCFSKDPGRTVPPCVEKEHG
jgi:hypothetical protein